MMRDLPYGTLTHQKLPPPKFQVQHRPQFDGVALACPEPVHPGSDKVSVEKAVVETLWIEKHLHERIARFPKPAVNRNGKTLLRSADYLIGEQSATGLPKEMFPFGPMDLAAVGKRKRQFHEVVVEKRYARLNRGSHAHLVLLHQKRDQIGLQLKVEEPVEEGSLAVR